MLAVVGTDYRPAEVKCTDCGTKMIDSYSTCFKCDTILCCECDEKRFSVGINCCKPSKVQSSFGENITSGYDALRDRRLVLPGSLSLCDDTPLKGKGKLSRRRRKTCYRDERTRKKLKEEWSRL